MKASPFDEAEAPNAVANTEGGSAAMKASPFDEAEQAWLDMLDTLDD